MVHNHDGCCYEMGYLKYMTIIRCDLLYLYVYRSTSNTPSYQPFHHDSCDILTKNNILLVPNLYNNYSGLVKLCDIL